MSIRRSLFVLLVMLVAAPARADDIGPIAFVQFSPNGRLAAFCSNASIKLWDTVANRKVGDLKGHADEVKAFTFAPDGKTLYSCGRDKKIRQWNLSNNQEIRSFDGHTSVVASVAVSPDGKTLASAGHDLSVRLWSVSTGKELRQFKRHACPVFCVAFSPDGKSVVSAGTDSIVRLWNSDTGDEIRTFVGNEGHVHAAVFTPDGKLLITCGHDGTARIFDVETGRELRRCQSHLALFFAALSPNGRTLATAGHDSTLRLWDVSTGHEFKRVECHKPGVLAVGFSPDGRSLISGGFDCNVKLWETATGKLRADYTANEAPADKPSAKLTAAELETLWKTLESDDAHKAFAAVNALIVQPQDAVSIMRKQLKVEEGTVDSKKVQKWIADLDDEDFTTRETAEAELTKVGRLAKGAILEALAKRNSVEVRRRLTSIVNKLEKNDPPARLLLETRALEVLENANTPEARKLLETLTVGTAELPMEAKAVLGRLEKRAR